MRVEMATHLPPQPPHQQHASTRVSALGMGGAECEPASGGMGLNGSRWRCALRARLHFDCLGTQESVPCTASRGV